MNGICQTTLCGNGTVDNGEQCDWGTANNVAGSGCNPDCTFSCQTTPSDSCPSADPCSATPNKCTVVPPPGSAIGNGQKCESVQGLAMCAACGNGGMSICVSNACTPNRCGDSCVDSAAGETCDPPNGTTCDANCHSIVCGDGVRSGKEQCDDGNTTNLDGCSSTCTFEQDQRANTINMGFNPPALCNNKNALGGAISFLAQGTLNTNLGNSVKSGGTSVLMKFLTLGDLTGKNEPNLLLGSFGGAPVAGAAYNGNSDADWWYTSSAGDLDGTRTPNSKATGSIVSLKLKASGALDFSLSLGMGTPSHVHMWSANMVATVGASNTPATSSGSTPGHLASEHLDPTLQSFASMSAGELCGNITSGSLDSIPIPTLLATGGSFACSQNYPLTASLLDVLVGGCGGNGFVTSTQPDAVDPSVSITGTGPYHFTMTGTDVLGCADTNNVTVNFQTCLTALSYSSDFTFTTDRVIAK
jgi:cysteine-rich repeat protein